MEVDLTAIYVTAGGVIGSILTILLGKLIFSREKKAEFMEHVRTELWDRIKHLEGRIDQISIEMNTIIKENAVLHAENVQLKLKTAESPIQPVLGASQPRRKGPNTKN